MAKQNESLSDGPVSLSLLDAKSIVLRRAYLGWYPLCSQL